MQPVFKEISTSIWGVQANEFDFIVDKLQPLLEMVITPETGYDIKSAAAEIKAQRWQLWVICDFIGIVITQVVERPLFSVLYVPWCAGSHVDEWIDDWLAVQEAYAKDRGCKYIESAGRPGWLKFKEAHSGYKVERYLYRKKM